MKTKNVILALVAVVFAIGSAFTSITPNNTHVFKNISPNSDCRNVTDVCQAAGTIQCQVRLLINGAPQVRNVYDTGCATLIKSNVSSPVDIDDEL